MQIAKAQSLVGEYIAGMHMRETIVNQIRRPQKDGSLQWFFAVDSKSRETVAETVTGTGVRSSDPVIEEIRSALQNAIESDNRKVAGLCPRPLQS